ncbi:hypothetical protein HNR46_003933 [Haloferula luteola]|uniref:Tyr recombinase domain-containing protein n=1 Tax=Haloferula luteola TaxID=595692 RepID=A0A840V6S6_9BACT|nr:hypothetical protein [Haloferula luteola]
MSEDYRLLYIMAIYTGLRLGELLGIVWSEVHLGEDERPRIVIPAIRSKNRREAVVPLHSKLRNCLQITANGARNSDLIFPQYAHPDRRFRRHLKEAGIPAIDGTGRKLDFHSFRYTFATRLARKGVSQRRAQELMRHSDPRLTANLYTDVNQLPTFEAVNSLDWFEDGKPSRRGPQIGPQNRVSAGQNLSQIGTENLIKNPLSVAGNETITFNLSPCDTKRMMVGVAGFEPADSDSVKRSLYLTCENPTPPCPHIGPQSLGPTCPKLEKIIECWDRLPCALREAVQAICQPYE